MPKRAVGASGETNMTEGRCLCGALHYQIDGPFVDMLHCHCSMCRKHHGTPFATWAAAPIAGFRWLSDTSSLATYHSSERGHRDFCRICGSVAPMVEVKLGMVIAPAGNLEGDPGIRPTRHMFVGSKAGWYEITDDLPQHEEYPPEFGMPSTPRAPVATEARRDAGQLPVRRGRLRDYVGAAAHVPVPLLALPPGPQRRALREHLLRGDGFPLGPRRRARRGVPAAGRAVFHHRLLPELRFGKLPRVSVERNIVVVPAGSLDSEPAITPAAHIFVGSKAPWFDITDELPQFAEMPPRR